MLNFPNQSRVFDQTRRAVRFWGHDSAMEWSPDGRLGAGVEYAVAHNWSAFVEYNYLDFGTKLYSFAEPAQL